MKNKVLALFLCFVLVLGTNSIIFAQETIQIESLPDDYFSNIYEYKYYENVRGTLTEDHDHQVFSWTVPEQQEYTIETTGNFATRLTEYTVNSNGEIIYSGTYTNDNNDNINASTKITAQVGRKYYFVIDAANTRDLFRNETPTFFRIRSEYNDLIDDYTNYTDTANDNAETGNYSNYVKKNCKIDYDGDVDVFVYNGCIGNGTIEFENADLPLNVTVYTLPSANDFGEQQRVKTFNIDSSGPLPQPITFSKNERVFIVIKQDQTGNYDEINSKYTFRYYAPNKMDQYDLNANSEYGNVPMYASDLGLGFHIEYPTLHYNDYDYYTFTPEYDGTEITATLGSTSSNLLYDINLYENVLIDPSQPTLYPTNPIASGIKEDNKKILKYNELKSGTKYYLEVKSPSPKTIYDSQNPYELTVIKKNTYSAVLKNDIILEHTAGNDINTTKDFFDIIIQNIECKVSDSIIPSDEARGHIQLIYNDRALSYSDINKLEPGEYPIIVKFYGDAATGGTVILKVSEAIILQDGILYPGMDVWWKTEKDEDLENYYFTLDSVDVIYNNKKYIIPEKTLQYNNEFEIYDYDKNHYYGIGIKVTSNGTAEYILDKEWSEDIKDIIYTDDFIIIPIINIWSDEYGKILTLTNYSFYLFCNERTQYPKDGVVYPNKDIWWSSSINWRYENQNSTQQPYASATFSLESINVVCKEKSYTVPKKVFYYDELLSKYDYQIYGEYLLSVKVTYNGPAEYVLTSRNSHPLPKNYYHSIYYDTYAIIPIAFVHADMNGQLILYSLMPVSIYTNGQYASKITVPTINSIFYNMFYEQFGDSISEISVKRNSAAAISNGDVYTWGDGAYYDLGHGNKDNVFYPKKVDRLPTIFHIAKGKNHTLAVDKDGYVWGWGNNSNSEVSPGSPGKVAYPTRVLGLSDVIMVAAGTGFSVALKGDGTVWTWGNHADSRLGDRGPEDSDFPRQVIGIDKVFDIACGEDFVVALSENKIYTWGGNSCGQLGDGTYDNRSTPQAIAESSYGGLNKIATGNKHVLAVIDNKLYTWGNNSVGQLGLNDKTNRNTPQYVCDNVSLVGAGYNHSMMICDDKLYTWGGGGNGQLGIGGTPSTVLKPTFVSEIEYPASFVKLDGGYDFTVLLYFWGGISVFGSNEKGQLGLYPDFITE